MRRLWSVLGALGLILAGVGIAVGMMVVGMALADCVAREETVTKLVLE